MSPQNPLAGAMLPLLLAAACVTGSAGGGRAAVRDSAGVQIVENTAPGWWEGAGWSLTEEPIVSIGGAEGEAAYDFGSANVVRLGDGRLAVADGEALEIRLYDPQGRHLASHGRKGGGPGEYQMLAGIYLGAGDSLLVPDMMQQRLSVLGPDGGFVRSFSLGGASGFVPFGGTMSLAVPMGWLADGSVLGASQAFQMNDPREGRYRDTMTLMVYGPDGAARDTVARVPSVEMERMTLTIGPQSIGVPSAVPLGRQTVIHGRGRRVYVATNDAWEIEERAADGTLVRLIRARVTPVPLTEADIAAHRKEMEELITGNPQTRMMPQQFRDQMLEHVAKAGYPPVLPFIARLLTDDEGMLWVQEVTRPGDERQQFAVVDSTGLLLGRLRMPERFVPMQFSRDAVAGVWKDPDDVEYVRVYGLRRG